MLNHLDPASALATGLLVFALIMVILFEATNGFHDAANAVATVIYTQSLQPGQAVVLSGIMNFVGVMVGGIAVAYALVELLPAEVLSPPDGGPAVAMLVSLFAAALTWNIGTWWFALPNSSSHCLIGSLIGVALGNAFARSRSLSEGVHWAQLWKVMEALALSPILGFVLAGALYFLCRKTLHDRHLYEPATDRPPIWWMRGILILTCTGVSFAHGTNDGQKSIGLIMLTIIGIFPATYALNPTADLSLQDLSAIMRQAEPLVMKYGDDEKTQALSAARSMIRRAASADTGDAGAGKLPTGHDSNGRRGAGAGSGAGGGGPGTGSAPDAGSASGGRTRDKSAEDGGSRRDGRPSGKSAAGGDDASGKSAGGDGEASGKSAGGDGEASGKSAADGGEASGKSAADGGEASGKSAAGGGEASGESALTGDAVGHGTSTTRSGSTAKTRSSIRDDVYQVISELKHAEEAKGIGADDKARAQALAKQLGQAVEYAPMWVRMLSALCLGVGTMIGYKRIVKTLGERLGNVHLTPAQGAAAEVVSAILIGTAGFTGLPVSTTHIVTSGIAGTMVTSGAGLKYGMISRIVIAWVFTLPVTILIAGGLYYLLASPKF